MASMRLKKRLAEVFAGDGVVQDGGAGGVVSVAMMLPGAVARMFSASSPVEMVRGSW